jgi:hypothetical protein
MTPNELPVDWWPEALQAQISEEPLAADHVLVAEVSRPWGERTYRHLYTALVPPGLVSAICSGSGSVGTEVRATGPHPAAHPASETPWYSPRFFIDGGGLIPEGLEPLCVAWTSANRTYLSPDQGFLMTYGLMPRSVEADHGLEIHWDDPSIPKNDVVINLPVSIYDFPNISSAHVKIRRDYLQDYAALRCLSMVQVFCAEAWQDPPSDMEPAYEAYGGQSISRVEHSESIGNKSRSHIWAKSGVAVPCFPLLYHQSQREDGSMANLTGPGSKGS